MNLMNQVFSMALLMLVAGVKFPELTAWLSAGFILSRACQLVGPNKLTKTSAMGIFSVIGFIVGNGTQFALIYYSYKSCQ